MSHDDLLGTLDGTRPTSGNPDRAGESVHQPGQPGQPGRRECSRKACRNAAAWRLEWNNPRIHTPDRRKTWLACDDHCEWLADYLRSRGLLKVVLPLQGDSTDSTEGSS
ncbi:hypothetical protein [Citricoccus sp. GCM10030269]|uniref:hypothetical protein n=1 Tax=Citricoccus sp. GCM10030269 TaxID=3273388 RepID=UPI00361831A3